jgi:hypothetical protein
MSYNDIVSRVNAALNFFADTVGVDYMEGFNCAEVHEQDADIKQDVWLFPELRKLGY